MIIQYHNIKKRLRNHLILAFMWLTWGVASFYLYNSTIPAYGFLFCSFGYFVFYWYLLKYPYLTIENGLIYTNSLISSKIALTDISSIETKLGEMTIKSDTKSIYIDTLLIDKESLKELKSILKITE